jgi:hypothetical protein
MLGFIMLYSDAVIYYYKKLLSDAEQLTKRKELAEELVQDLWIAAKDNNFMMTSKSWAIPRSGLYKLFLRQRRGKGAIQYIPIGNKIYTMMEDVPPPNSDGRDVHTLIGTLNNKPGVTAALLAGLKHTMLVDAAEDIGISYKAFKKSHAYGIRLLKGIYGPKVNSK